MMSWECPRCRTIHAGWVASCSCRPGGTASTNTESIQPINDFVKPKQQAEGESDD